MIQDETKSKVRQSSLKLQSPCLQWPCLCLWGLYNWDGTALLNCTPKMIIKKRRGKKDIRRQL